MSNKWYNLFVSIEKEGEAAAPAEPDAAAAVAAIAAQVAPVAEEKFTGSVPAGVSAGSMSIAEIYQAAEIAPPPGGFTIMKVGELLQSPHIKALPPEVKRSSVLLALEAAGVKIEDVIQDAIRRDKALDTFEALQLRQLEAFETAKTDESRKLQAEIDQLIEEKKAKLSAANEEVSRKKEQFEAWRRMKQTEEQKIAETVSHFVTENPITTSGRITAPKPGAGI